MAIPATPPLPHHPPPPRIGAVLLAAGSASRMGHQPKCLLELDGVPLIRRLLTALSGAGADELVVVLGHYADRIEPVVRDFPVTLVHNPDPDAGQISSLRLGLQALPGQIDAVLVALADQPLIHSQDIRDLIGAYRMRPADTEVVQPTVDGLPGNPVVFSQTVREQILASEARVGCRQWQQAHPQAVHRWATTNTRYRTDVDSPDDIESLAARTGQRLRWPAGPLVEAPLPTRHPTAS